MLRIALKTLTGSREVIEIMNRLEDCASYHIIEEVESEVTFESTNRSLLTPIRMKLNPRCGTGVAWDNFDWFDETITGKETLHDTVGITYQLQRKNQWIKNLVMMRIYRLKKKNVLQEKLQKLFPRLFILRKDGAYQSRSLNIIPYRKKLKLRTSDFLSNDNPKRLKFENTSASTNNWKIDILWMLVNLFSK